MNRFSTSFSKQEINALSQILSKMCRCEDVRLLIKNKATVSVMKKIQAMKDRSEIENTVEAMENV